MCMWAISLLWSGVFFIFLFLDYQGQQKEGCNHIKERQRENRSCHFSAMTPICFFSSLLFPSFHCFCCSWSRSIHWSIEDCQSLEVCVSCTQGCWFFRIMHVLCFFTVLGVCNLNFALSNIFFISFYLLLLLFNAIWVDITTCEWKFRWKFGKVVGKRIFQNSNKLHGWGVSNNNLMAPTNTLILEDLVAKFNMDNFKLQEDGKVAKDRMKAMEVRENVMKEKEKKYRGFLLFWSGWNVQKVVEEIIK